MGKEIKRVTTLNNTKIKAQTDDGYYIHFECIESAISLGLKKSDILYSANNRVAVNGFKWFFIDENYFNCISQTDGFGKCEKQCEFCKSEQK